MTDAEAKMDSQRPPGAAPAPAAGAAAASEDPPEPTIQDQVAALVEQRGYDPLTALQLATTWKSEQCECAIGVLRKDDCLCHYHCDCCCEPLFRCFNGCKCVCSEDCHYDPEEPDIQAAQASQKSPLSEEVDGAEEPPRAHDPSHQHDQTEETNMERAQTEQNGRKEHDGDAEMKEAPTRPVTTWTLGLLFEKLAQNLSSGMQDEDLDQAAGPFAAAFFEKLYAEALSTGMTPKAGCLLPALSPEELELLLELMKTLLDQQATLTRFTNTIKDAVRTTFRSTWKLVRILADHRTTASAPGTSGPNAWGQKSPSAAQATLAADMATFRFDTSIFAEEDIQQLRKVCSASHPFATATREPDGDEWMVIYGIMAGTIATRALPQFLRRVCNMEQFQWFHYQMVVWAEGELYVTLPTQAKVFDFNQTAKRLSDTILAAVDYQRTDPTSVRALLQAAKTLSYNHDLRTIHFFFDTKADAIRFEGWICRFATSK